jgi:hypothetical protein
MLHSLWAGCHAGTPLEMVPAGLMYCANQVNESGPKFDYVGGLTEVCSGRLFWRIGGILGTYWLDFSTKLCHN